MAVPPRPIVSDFEIAALVHVYLESSGYKKTAASFKRLITLRTIGSLQAAMYIFLLSTKTYMRF